MMFYGVSFRKAGVIRSAEHTQEALRVWRVHRDDGRKSDSLVWPLRQQCLETAGIVVEQHALCSN